MFTNFENMPPMSRLWIYQAQNTLPNVALELIEKKLQTFVASWEAHQQPLLSSFKIFYKQFVVIAIDEAQQAATGCSIDKGVAVMKEIGATLQVDFFDRLSICYMENGVVKTTSTKELKEKIANEVFSANTLVFDNTIRHKHQLETQWLQPAHSTWLQRYFAVSAG
jgi:hypothetical protein